MRKVLLLILAIMLIGCSEKETEKNIEKDVEKEVVVKEEEKIVPVKYEEVAPESKEMVDKFVKKYNVRVDFYKEDLEDPTIIAKIAEPITSELNKEDNIFKQILLDTDFKEYEGHYKIVAKYNEDKKITGYTLSVEGLPINEISEEADEWEEGMLSAMSIVDSLGLNLDKFDEEFDKVLDEEKDTHTYTDSNYKITFLLPDIDLGLYEIDYDLTN
ncbi:hypothetical protein AEA09_04040 [Lysinibacillus contaminans]|uniref:Lipoprotein n=1 Tax=Lysinibacillus contaminans TaxID=1293441 RepID=A0ABR5JYS2_9BACI|nr:hypothetical protein [Lysinibacillus contaminans]KOS67807.1 hypothetical protein AEA09_04040 [Lysinibacillus contaminans]